MAKKVEDGSKHNVRPMPDYGTAFPTVYSNHIAVSHTVTEIFIDCCLISSPYKPDLEEGVLPVPVVARVIVPPVLVAGLIEALKAQIQKQQKTAETREIPIGTRPPRKEPS